MKSFDYSVTLTGPRKDNQDTIGFNSYQDYTVACIADGVGGEQGGKLASSYCVGLFLNYAKDETLFNSGEIARLINEKLLGLQQSISIYPRMATTLTGCIVRSNLLHYIHTGDTRLYIIRKNTLNLLTEDQNYKKNGAILSNILTSAIGIGKDIQIISGNFQLSNHDRILLTTDGFHNKIDDSAIEQISKKAETMFEFSNYLKSAISNVNLDDNCSFLAFEYQE